MKLSERLARTGSSPQEPVEPPAAPRRRSTAAAAAEERPVEAAAPARPRPAPVRTKKEPAARRRTADEAPADDLQELRAKVRAAAVTRLGPQLRSMTVVDEGWLKGELEGHLDEALRTSRTTVPPSERGTFLDTVIAEMLGWGALTPLMEDPSVTEVMCNGPDEVWVERAGKLERTDIRFPSTVGLRQVIDRMLATAGRRVDEASPMADGRLPDGSRVNAVVAPLAVHGPLLTVRRFPEQAFTVTDLIVRESLSQDAAVFLEAAVRGKLNIIVSGGTGTGKTTLLNVLSGFVPDGERIITIEDAAELRLSQDHVVSLEGRPANVEGVGQVSIRDLVRNALRMRPDRIVVGEVRGGEALDMLQAMNTGHEGSLTTVHANTPRDALSRIETMVLMAGLDLPLRAVREQVAAAVDVVVQLERRPDGGRVVSRITEVQGREGDTITLQDVFARNGGGALKATGLRPKSAERLAERGVTVPAALFRGRPATATAAPRRAR